MRLLPLLLLAGCSSDDRAPASPPPPQRRVIEPPGGTVQAGPPYVIGEGSIGPYKLQQNVGALTDRLLKGGPGGVRFEVPNLLHSGLIRAEEDSLLIGTEPVITSASTTTFLAVTSAGVAAMEQGVHVGSTRDEAIKLGTAGDDPDHARDPRVLAPGKNVRLVLDKDRKRVLAIVLTPEVQTPHEPPECPRPAVPLNSSSFGICLTGAGEVVDYVDGDLVVHLPDSDKPLFRVPESAITNLVFATALRNPTDGRDELVVITRSGDDATQRIWSMIAFRVDPATKRGLEPALEKQYVPLYAISTAQARWIGSELREIDLYLELTSRGDTIEVGGLLTTQRRDRVKDVSVISTVSVPRRHHKPATATDGGSDAPQDAGLPDRSQGSGKP